MFLRLLSPRQRSARALLLSSQHATRFHDAEAFRATTTTTTITSPASSSAQFRFRHVPASWPLTRPVAVANKSLSGPKSVSDLAPLPLRAHVNARTRIAVHSCARRSPIPITSSPVRLFSVQSSRGTVSMGAQDASVLLQDDGRNGNGIPAQDGLDPESEEEVPVEAEELQDALTRPPAVNSSYLPLPWKGRLGYVSLICALSCVYMLMRKGLSEYVFALFQSACLLLANMSHSLYPRESPSAARSFPTASSNQEPSRPESTR